MRLASLTSRVYVHLHVSFFFILYIDRLCDGLLSSLSNVRETFPGQECRSTAFF